MSLDRFSEQITSIMYFMDQWQIIILDRDAQHGMIDLTKPSIEFWRGNYHHRDHLELSARIMMIDIDI